MSKLTTSAQIRGNTHNKDEIVKLGILRAICHAFASRPLDYYPRVIVGNNVETLPTTEVLEEMAIASSSSDAFDISEETLKLARQSLDEVKDQTEYQDQKATRLLTDRNNPNQRGLLDTGQHRRFGAGPIFDRPDDAAGPSTCRIDQRPRAAPRLNEFRSSVLGRRPGDDHEIRACH